MQTSPIIVDGEGLTLANLIRVARDGAHVELSSSPAVRARIDASRRHVEDVVAAGRPVYGVTTRLGGLATALLTPDEARDMQNNALWMHKTGAGHAIDRADVRAGMLLRLNSLMRGASGIRFELLERLQLFLNRSITPVVHEFGSIGASGDLVPLSYIAGALIGSEAGYAVHFEQRIIDAREALASIGLAPLKLEAKEGLALINGTSLSTAIAGGCLWDASRLIDITLGFHAVALEALRTSMEPFDPFVQGLKPHPGQLWVAGRMRALLAGSRLTRQANAGEPAIVDGLIQDRYSLPLLSKWQLPRADTGTRDGSPAAVPRIGRETR
jgi:phenylalanine ammonia-lyase